jgi:hypothetical protein
MSCFVSPGVKMWLSVAKSRQGIIKRILKEQNGKELRRVEKEKHFQFVIFKG